MKSLVEAALLDQERRIIDAKPSEIMDVRERKRKTKPCRGGCGREVSANSRWRCSECQATRKMHQQGWTASRSPCGPDDVDAR